jgi:hypothetical protein
MRRARSLRRLLPDAITLDEFGFPVVQTDRLPRRDRELRRAVGACPAPALRIATTVAG